jgi:hypothetical protein
VSADAILEAVQALNPRTLERARRLTCALSLLRSGLPRRDACATLRLRFPIGQPEAWRMVNLAAEIQCWFREDGK